MTDLKLIIARVEALLAEGTPQSVTYAALECRLTIEKVCYDRLQIAHDYISHEDLRRWQPRDVVETLIAEVDGKVASSFSLHISPTPVDPSAPPSTREDYEQITDWVEVGRQVGFDPARLGRIWHSLSGLALHVRLPKSKEDAIPDYGDPEAIRKKVDEAVVELRMLANGTLITSGIGGEEVSFKCSCGRLNKRRAPLVSHGQTVSCVGPECLESFTATIEGDSVSFAPRRILIKCDCCEQIEHIPLRKLEKMKRDEVLIIDCACGARRKIAWRLGQTASVRAGRP